MSAIESMTSNLCEELDKLPLAERIEAINTIRRALHEAGPFKDEPVDLVLWVVGEHIKANDYNPNKVAPPEMALLRKSIQADGYTQPIVGYQDLQEDRSYTVVDGFHRYTIGTDTKEISARLHGYLPVTEIRQSQTGESDRIASTIRHNRARGTHNINLMVNIVADLVGAGMSDDWIAKNIGMDADELLRLKQISGLAALFKDNEFSKAWEATTC